MLEIKNSVTEMKDTFDGSLIDLTHLRRESVSLKIGQQKLPKLKCKEKKRMKKMEQNVQELLDNFKICNIHVAGISEGEDRRKEKKYLK